MKYQRESFAEVIEDIKPLLAKHYQEICAFPDKLKLNPDYDKYIALDEIGCLHVVTAREESKLIGYMVTFIAPHIHYQDTVQGINDILYVSESHRGTTTGYKLFKAAMKELKKEGVELLSMHMKKKHEFRRLLAGLGFQGTEEIWEVWL
jgi:GNAT superfamily N-acetyltransferase